MTTVVMLAEGLGGKAAFLKSEKPSPARCRGRSVGVEDQSVCNSTLPESRGELASVVFGLVVGIFGSRKKP